MLKQVKYRCCGCLERVTVVHSVFLHTAVDHLMRYTGYAPLMPVEAAYAGITSHEFCSKVPAPFMYNPILGLVVYVEEE